MCLLFTVDKMIRKQQKQQQQNVHQSSVVWEKISESKRLDSERGRFGQIKHARLISRVLFEQIISWTKIACVE